MASQPAIAIIDDDALVRSSMVSLLRSFGLRVEAFASGQAFLDAGPTAFDGVISDIQMPGMSGIELLRRLDAEHPNLPVLLITGQPDEHVRRQALEAGAAAFLEKPFPAEDIMDELSRAIGSIEG